MAKIRLQGPFGGGNQDWYKFEVAVMIGAGEGEKNKNIFKILKIMKLTTRLKLYFIIFATKSFLYLIFF